MAPLAHIQPKTYKIVTSKQCYLCPSQGVRQENVLSSGSDFKTSKCVTEELFKYIYKGQIVELKA